MTVPTNPMIEMGAFQDDDEGNLLAKVIRGARN